MSKTGEEFVCSGALCRCDKGLLPMPLMVNSNQTVKLQGRLVATTLDKVFPPFGTCAVKNNTPCVPALLMWQDYYETVGIAVPGAHPLLEKSTIKCALGGTVSIMQTMQLSIPGPPAPPQVEGLRTSSMSLCPVLMHGADGGPEAASSQTTPAGEMTPETAAARDAAEAARQQAEMKEALVAAAQKQADDLVAERERIKAANETRKPKNYEPQTVTSPVAASIADPKVMDPATGKPAIYQGENFNMKSAQGRAAFAKFKKEAHPVLKARIAKQEALLKSGWKPENPLSGTNPGAHAEIVAFDKVLKARKAAGMVVDDNTIQELYLHNRSLLPSQYPNGTPKRCDHCARILDGINTIGHD